MRTLDVPEQADIMVSELLGSFGDNELSPECLDGAMRFLKRESGVVWPWRLIQPTRITPIDTSRSLGHLHSYLVHRPPRADLLIQAPRRRQWPFPYRRSGRDAICRDDVPGQPVVGRRSGSEREMRGKGAAVLAV